MRYVLLLLLITGFKNLSCSEASTSSEKLENISYDKHAACVMDVFLPGEIIEEKPFVILIHGGAWIAGDKQWLGNLLRVVQRRDAFQELSHFRILFIPIFGAPQVSAIRLGIFQESIKIRNSNYIN